MTGIENTTLYNEDMKGISTDNASFEFFRKNDVLYVDKTEFIYKLLCAWPRRFFFVSRPRRFGKSLFCNSLESLFKGEKELFKGLYIYDKYDFKPYPVLHFDFNNMDADSIEDFIKGLKGKIILQAEEVGIDIDSSYGPAMMFEMLIERLYRRDGEIVIIQDEYDAPLTSAAIGNPEMAEGIRKTLNSFYATIKNKAGMIRFCFITGVVKLSNLSIFSAMNNLVDLSMDKEFAGAFGYTDEELDEYFGEGIDEYLEANPGKYKSREEFREKIRNYYDGYRFSPESETRVYNPVSIGFFFNDGCKFSNYWYKTGGSALVVKLAENFRLEDLLYDDIQISEFSLVAFDISKLNRNEGKTDTAFRAALLYYTGYLSIKTATEEKILLGFPNNEVSSSFTNYLLEKYSKDDEKSRLLVTDARIAAKEGKTEEIIRALNAFYDQCTSVLISKRYEQPYQLIMHMFFVAAGCRVVAELPTKLGRIDNSMEIGKHIYLFELKVDKSADEAISQIQEKKYGDIFKEEMKKGKILHLIGIDFSSEERTIRNYREEVIS